MIFLMIALLLILLILTVSFVIYRLTFYYANDRDQTFDLLSGKDYDEYHGKMRSLVEEAVKIPFEEVFTTSYDGKKLFGRIYFKKEGAPFHIEFNGYKGNGIRDFCGGLRLALEREENVLLVDQRSHGRSEGHTISYGIRERHDVPVWISYILKRYGEDTPIYLEGISMGASTVLMASDLDLPENVKGIFADCPYSRPFDIIADYASKTVKFSKLLHPFFGIAAYLFGGFNLFETSAEAAVAKTNIPICIVHGNGDHFVPIEMSKRIRDANPGRVTYVEVEGAPHGLSYVLDYELYRKTFYDFLDKNR